MSSQRPLPLPTPTRQLRSAAVASPGGTLRDQPTNAPSPLASSACEGNSPKNVPDRGTDVIDEDPSRSEFTVEALITEAGLSSRHLERKVNPLIGYALAAAVHCYRLDMSS